MQAFDDRDGFIWMDGELLPWREVKLHILTHGLHYGGSVFEGERAYDGEIFKLRAHSERLVRSAELIGMPLPYDADAIDAATKETVEANKLTDCYIRPFAWRGSKKMGLAADPSDVHVAVACWPWPKYLQPKAGPGTGMTLQTSTWRRMDPRSFPVQSKSAGIYAVGTMAKQNADAAGFDDALVLDVNGKVAEASAANLFAVYDGVLKTPRPDSFLNGLTRQTVIELAQEMGITVEECVITPEELLKADEIFLTGTAAEIEDVSRIDSHTIPHGGPVTKRMQQAYSDLVHSKA